MSTDIFHEITRRSIPLTKSEEITLSWRDSVICVKTDKAINFFEFSYNLECLDKKLDVTELSVPCPTNSPATELCKSRFLTWEMKNYDYTEMILDNALWPHNSALTKDMTNLTKIAWSPPYFVENKSVLAILNNIGCVLIKIQKQYKWETVLDFSDYIRDHLEYKKMPNNFQELKESVCIVETSAMCWAPTLNTDHSCYFVTAQKNNVFLFWQIFNDMRTPVLKRKITHDMFEIKNMLWIPISDNIIWLACANVMGQMSMYEIKMDNEEFSLINSHVLWNQDRMIAEHFHYKIINEVVLLIFSKRRYFIVMAFDRKCKSITKFIKNINDHTITDITCSHGEFYLSTINVKILKLNITFDGCLLQVDFIPIELKEPFPNYELHGVGFSKTNTLCALGMIDRKLLCRKELFKVEVIFISTDAKLESLMPMLLNNPTKKFTDYYDCIETLRYRINKTKKMPEVDSPKLYSEGSTDIYKLKLYLILLIFYLSMRKMARVYIDSTLPELSVEKVKEKILLLHAQTRIKTLYEKHKQNGSLSDFENESLNGCLKYIQSYSKKHKNKIAIDENILRIVNSDIKYICQSCDENVLEGFTCSSGHLNMYCMLSFTPISDDYLVCKCCNSTARADISVDDSLCVFCDQYLTESI